MKKVLFKSEELTIVADSDGAILYGTAPKNTAIKYLSNLTPETTKEAIGIAELGLLILTSKYVIAKKITIVTEVTVTAAKSSMVKTAEDALRIASKFGLKAEVQRELDNGATPISALREWDIL